MSDADKIFDEIIGAQKVRNPELRALIEERMKAGGEASSKREKLRELLGSGTMAAMDTGKVEMRKAPGAKKAEEALSTAAEFIPFVGAGKAAAEGDYGSAALQAGMDVAGGPLLKGAAALGGKFLAPALMGAIKAYHGSPHKFDKFDISKIGSGEGAQAFGHGLYFAESPEVARTYSADRKYVGAAMSGKPMNINYDDPTWIAQQTIDEMGDAGKAKAHLERVSKLAAKNMSKESADAVRGAIQLIDSGAVAKKGNLYEVDLRWPDAAREAADPLSPHHFLDWDKSLSEQGGVERFLKLPDYARPLDDVEASNVSGQRLHQRLSNELGESGAAEALRAAGIPGIRYLDAGSRSSGGTSNYVLFSDELAEILKRNDEQLKASKVAAPQDEALRIAEQKGVEMLGLPLGNTPMDRARAMGYEGGLYHGGTNDVPAFAVNERSNVYATDEPRIGNIYATATGRHLSLREINAGPNVMPLMYRGKLAEVSDQGATGGGWYNDNLSALTGLEGGRKIIKEVPKKGFSGVKIVDMDDLGGRQTQYVFPDPSVLRSRFAAFDPSRIHENDLLAGLAALGIGLPALSLSTDKDYD